MPSSISFPQYMSLVELHFRVFVGVKTQVELRVIGVWMHMNTVSMGDINNVRGIQNENWPEHAFLWNSTKHRWFVGLISSELYTPRMIFNERLDAREDCALDAESILSAVDKNGMINRVNRGRQMKKIEQWNIAFVSSGIEVWYEL